MYSVAYHVNSGIAGKHHTIPDSTRSEVVAVIADRFAAQSGRRAGWVALAISSVCFGSMPLVDTCVVRLPGIEVRSFGVVLEL